MHSRPYTHGVVTENELNFEVLILLSLFSSNNDEYHGPFRAKCGAVHLQPTHLLDSTNLENARLMGVKTGGVAYRAMVTDH